MEVKPGTPPNCSGFVLVDKFHGIPESCSIILSNSGAPLGKIDMKESWIWDLLEFIMRDFHCHG